jgi:hypothetical protein
MRWKALLAAGIVLAATACSSDSADQASPALSSSVVVTTSTSVPHEPAPCHAAAMLPVVRRQVTAGGNVDIVRVEIIECRNGYARVAAVPDNSECRADGTGSCYDSEQVFLKSNRSSWTYITSGTGIACGTDGDLTRELEAACVALGLRSP